MGMSGVHLPQLGRRQRLSRVRDVLPRETQLQATLKQRVCSDVLRRYTRGSFIQERAAL